jgi:UDP:flavonoid glycosyltransferase YjiC (YdhE family)
MWRAEQDNTSVLAKERLFDLVIEPSDLAGSRDRGATAARKDGVAVTDPIRLIDDHEQLSREEARDQLGLALDRLAVLVQLGPGNGRSVAIASQRVFSALQQDASVDVVSLSTPITRDPIRQHPDVRDITVYPIGRFLQAFDFAISAAGYNSFHELLTSGVPTIFLVSMRPELDDQEARASFAEAMGAGYFLSSSNLQSLPSVVQQMMKPDRRAAIRDNCSRLSAANGARQAADLIAEIAR